MSSVGRCPVAASMPLSEMGDDGGAVFRDGPAAGMGAMSGRLAVIGIWAPEMTRCWRRWPPLHWRRRRRFTAMAAISTVSRRAPARSDGFRQPGRGGTRGGGARSRGRRYLGSDRLGRGPWRVRDGRGGLRADRARSGVLARPGCHGRARNNRNAGGGRAPPARRSGTISAPYHCRTTSSPGQ